jgi:hypothetical protein
MALIDKRLLVKHSSTSSLLSIRAIKELYFTNNHYQKKKNSTKVRLAMGSLKKLFFFDARVR